MTIWAKGDALKPPPLIGRFGTSLKIGIVGLPNVGKSTFFNVLTKSEAAAENFPFCTIDPNESRVPIPDERYDFLCQFHKPASKVPAFLNVVDIAGLVKGAHVGQGLGNAFLSHISACDGIFHMTRAFEDEDIIHVEGTVDPVRDMEIIHEELRMKDEEMISPIIDKLEKTAIRGGDKKLKPEYDIMCKIKGWVVDEKKHVRYYPDWNDKEIEVLNKFLFLTSKPMIYLVNLSERDYIRRKNKWLVKIKEWVDSHDPGALVIPFSGNLESKLQDMSEEERHKYCTEQKTQSALNKIIKTGYAALQLEYFFTTGPDEVRAWTIRKGTKAPQAAGKIHTDFEKGFIMAEVMKFQDFKEEGSESAVKVSSQSARGDEGKSPVISGADRHHTAPTENCSSPLLRGRNYCTHSSTTPDKPAGSDSKHCHCAPAVHIFITMCLNWLIVVPACGSDRGGTSLRICQSDTLLAWSYVWPNPKPLCSDGNMKRQVK
uniref:Obg-like ATPase 1 n=1 Tax=Oryzias latipes TaxID=8090 RepID=H2MSX4_ORYLA